MNLIEIYWYYNQESQMNREIVSSTTLGYDKKEWLLLSTFWYKLNINRCYPFSLSFSARLLHSYQRKTRWNCGYHWQLKRTTQQQQQKQKAPAIIQWLIDKVCELCFCVWVVVSVVAEISLCVHYFASCERGKRIIAPLVFCYQRPTAIETLLHYKVSIWVFIKLEEDATGNKI